MKNNIQELYALEKLSRNNTCVHRLNPSVKLLTSAVFTVTVVSFSRYDLVGLIPYIFYPTLLTALSETPYSMLVKRFLVALPFCLFAGISNVIFNPTLQGAISFGAILFKSYLCVMAVLLLVSVTPLSELTNAMRRLKIPSIFAVIFEMTYRYIGVLFEETYTMYTAYTLRNGGGKGIALRDIGSFAGQLLLRSFDRAERVYNAMKCRGYSYNGREIARGNSAKVTVKDVAYLLSVCMLCIAFRVINVGEFYAWLV